MGQSTNQPKLSICYERDLVLLVPELLPLEDDLELDFFTCDLFLLLDGVALLLLLDIRVVFAFGFLELVFFLTVLVVVFLLDTVLGDLVTFLVLVFVFLGVTVLGVVVLGVTLCCFFVLGVTVLGVVVLGVVVLGVEFLVVVALVVLGVEDTLLSPVRLGVVTAVLFPPLVVASCL